MRSDSSSAVDRAERGVSIELDRIVVVFDGRRILHEVSLTIAPGEVVALLGGSGTGKSTVLRVVAGTLAPDAGRVLLDGADVTTIPAHRRDVGMVFQDNQLFPHLSVRDNVAYGLRVRGVPRVERARRAEAALADVGLSALGDRSVTELSGGEAKRVALARSLITAPGVLLLDEPLTGLDRSLRDELMADLGDRLRALRTTAVVVTHDPHEAATLAGRTIQLAELGVASPDSDDRVADE